MADNYSSINKQHIKTCFIEGLYETISMMTGFAVFEKAEIEIKYELAGAMLLIGERTILITIGTNAATAAILVSYMTGTDISKLSETEIIDGMAEITNMVGGLAKARLSHFGYSFNLSAPFGITGENIKLITRKNVEGFECVLGCDKIEIKLGVHCF